MRIKRLEMRKPSWLTLFFLVLAALFFAAMLLNATYAAPLSGYSLDWWTLDSGGGISSGGSYKLSGGIAQLDTGMISGGNYQVQGGFWQGNTFYIHLPLVVR